MMMARAKSEYVDYVFHHVFFPPKRPQSCDDDAEHCCQLLRDVTEALSKFRSLRAHNEAEKWMRCESMVQALYRHRASAASLDVPALAEDLKTLSGEQRSLAIEVRGQNAGILINKSGDGTVVVEAFELSASNTAVMGSAGRLRRSFSGPGVSLPATLLSDATFCNWLAQSIAMLDAEIFESAAPKTTKAKSSMPEIRDTADPKYVTHLLLFVLLALGSRVPVQPIHKHIRDDVLWDNTDRPWRRSPTWLLMRVALQRTLMVEGTELSSLADYKAFVVYFMVHLLEKARTASSEYRYIARAKILRRLQKLSPGDDEEWYLFVHRTIEANYKRDCQIWNRCQSMPDMFDTRSLWNGVPQSDTSETVLSLKRLRKHIASIQSRDTSLTGGTKFAPPLIPRSGTLIDELPSLDQARSLSADVQRILLCDVESWVRNNLDRWSSASRASQEACAGLAILLKSYVSIALKLYTSKPEPDSFSIMCLTAMELWVALDKRVAQEHSMLCDHPTGFPEGLLNHLLLPQRSQLTRLQEIEAYLSRREQRARAGFPSPLHDMCGERALGVRYYAHSCHHKHLRAQIGVDAARKKADKLAELREKRQQYDDLLEQAQAMACQYVDDTNRHGELYTYHARWCKKCELERRAGKMSIDVYEWPLPQDETDLKAVIFELDVPRAIFHWRDATFFAQKMIFNQKRSLGKQQSDLYLLPEYGPPERYHQSPHGLLMAGSELKPLTVTHYREQKLSVALESNVCVNHAMRYQFYDTSERFPVADVISGFDIQSACTLPIPVGPYKNLEDTMRDTCHTSNAVQARQINCSHEISLHEHEAYGEMRCGENLQLYNLARELAVPVLNLSRVEVSYLILQTIWQAGSSDGQNVLRKAHLPLDDESFASDLLNSTEDALRRCEGNWQRWNAVYVLTTLTQRVLSVTTHERIVEHSVTLLRRIRSSTMAWTRDLIQHRLRASGDGKRAEIDGHILNAALVCHVTFDSETQLNVHTFASEEDFSVYCESLITMNDHLPTSSDMPLQQRYLLTRASRISHSLERHVQSMLELHATGLNKAINRVWPAFSPHEWREAGMPWLETRHAAHGHYQTVHFNVLSGALLIDGAPLSRPTARILDDPSYTDLFPKMVVDVIPSSMPGMRFECRADVFGYRVHFGLLDDQLIIRAQINDETLEFIPRKHLVGDFPIHLVDEFVHWFSVKTGKLAWRPKARPWECCPQSWCLVPRQGAYTLERQQELLVDVEAQTFKAVAQLLSGLDEPANIQVCRRSESGNLEVTLPRLQLNFGGICGELELQCQQYPDFSIDSNQDIGTWTGLRSKLVLCSSDGRVRKVIVPFGNVRCQWTGSRANVNIFSNAQKVRYFMYVVDNILGRLKGDDITASRLYLSYLHAVTSTSLEDHLTSMTGTEKALDLLTEPAIRSQIAPYDSVELDLLDKIAALSPKRQYYPAHLCVMQRVNWSDQLPVLSQHYRFRELVENVFTDTAVIRMFHSSLSPRQRGWSTDRTLEQKAALHEAPFRVDNFGAEAYSHKLDALYDGREHNTNADLRLEQVFQLCQLVDTESTQLKPTRNLFEIFQQWQKLHGPHHLRQPFHHIALLPGWLRDPLKMLPQSWFSLLNQLAQVASEDAKYHLMFLISMLVMEPKIPIEWVETFVAFSALPELRSHELPLYDRWDLVDGCAPDHDRLLSLMAQHARPFQDFYIASSSVSLNRARSAFLKAREEYCSRFVELLLEQWPCIGEDIDPPQIRGRDYVNVAPVISTARKSFDSWYRNRQLQIHATNIQCWLTHLLPATRSRPESCRVDRPAMIQSTPRQSPGNLALWDLFKGDAPNLSAFRFRQHHNVLRLRRTVRESDAIRQLAEEDGAERHNGVNAAFRTDLLASVAALEQEIVYECCEQPASWSQLLSNYANRSFDDSSGKMCQMQDAFLDNRSSAQVLAMKCQLGPRRGAYNLLKLLSISHRSRLSSAWHNALVRYGLSVSCVQQASRFLVSQHDFVQVSSEWQLDSRTGWNPCDRPDWLLFELETEKSIRPVQARIASEMVQTRHNGGSILQLNMGEGKTSVIIPLVAMNMVSGGCLARIVVLKQLAPSMMSNLATCLGGLAGRKVRYLPFSRSVQLPGAQIEFLQERLVASLSAGDVWIAQPEHALSFELYGIDHVLRDHPEGEKAINLQRWIDSNVRNILDESDEILDPRHELVYAMGKQQSMDLGPARWSLIIEVLDFINIVARSGNNASLVEVSVGQDNAFPFVRITKQSEGEIFVDEVLKQILSDGLTTIPLQKLKTDDRTTLHQFLTQKTPSEYVTAEVERLFKSDPDKEKGVLLLRGLFSGELLMFVFQHHRWRVSYGLAPDRTSLAIPYRAKDQPSPRSEFSHPDLTMILTSLSYFYRGLTQIELRQCFETLARSDNAEDEYQLWTRSRPDTEPPTPTQWTGVNLEDQTQWSNAIVPALSQAKEVVKFHLSRHVFPHAMREFPHKLATSGWNLGKSCHHPTTGFSGTNDGRFLLPASLEQIDLPEQRHTNALVLNTLLRPENAVHRLSTLLDTSQSRTLHILRTISHLQPGVQVLIDVGAQMLDMDNKLVAQTWLSLRVGHGVDAAVFYGDDDRAYVVDRDGFVEPLQGSPRASMLGTCVFYLDDVHTRGVDFRFPAGFRAAVTIAPGLVKDRLCQACMRMRRLGRGHSVVFLVQDEVLDAIRETRPGVACGDLSVGDIIRWTIFQTYNNVHHLLPLWVNQGVQFDQFASSLSLVHNADNDSSRKSAAKTLLQEESQTLYQRYSPHESGWQQLKSQLATLGQSERRDAQHILKVWKAFGGEAAKLSGLREEQERELSPESEQERQIERPPPAKPLQHCIHPDVRRFINTGLIDQDTSAFQLLSSGLLRRKSHTELDHLSGIAELVMTPDFARSVVGDDEPGSELFNKSVRWLVRSSLQPTCAVLSSFEANELLPQIRTSQHVQLSVYAARTNMNSRALEGLTFCKTPSDRNLAAFTISPRTLLSVFAGQTYFTDWHAYQHFCQLFGLYYQGQAPIDSDFNGFVAKGSRERYDKQMHRLCPFSSDPTIWLREVMAMRRKGQPYGGSHVGLVVRGVVLRPDRHW